MTEKDKREIKITRILSDKWGGKSDSARKTPCYENRVRQDDLRSDGSDFGMLFGTFSLIFLRALTVLLKSYKQ